ncbi:MAG TPA: DUF488 domain-containing protein [Solirubrobacteraceae bacterium]|jgi:uncharacterized protein (DUF488 family)
MGRLAIWTIGHSNYPLEMFARLLQMHRIELIADVRSFPYSRFAPQYGREELAEVLSQMGLEYQFMGTELGGRPNKEEHYDEQGHALYQPMSQEPGFIAAIDGLVEHADQTRIALLCSEAHPEYCHRRLLVGKVLTERGVQLRHILHDASVVPELSVPLPPSSNQQTLFGPQEQPWRSTQSVLHRRLLNTSLID